MASPKKYQFHEKRGKHVTLIDDRNTATRKQQFLPGLTGVVFSSVPLQPAQSFIFRVDDPGWKWLHIGVLKVNPVKLNMKNDARDQPDASWCFSPYFTDAWGLGESSCSKWHDAFGHNFDLSQGDIVTLTLDVDNTFSFSVNDKQVKGIFGDLCNDDLWLIVDLGVNQISILQQGELSVSAHDPKDTTSPKVNVEIPGQESDLEDPAPKIITRAIAAGLKKQYLPDEIIGEHSNQSPNQTGKRKRGKVGNKRNKLKKTVRFSTI